MAVVVAAMVLANVVLLMVNRDAETKPRAGDGPRPTASGPLSSTGTSSSPSRPSSSSGAPDAGAATPPGDGPPNHVDNNAWKQGNDPSADDQAAGEDLADRVRAALEVLRAAGDLTTASTRQAFLDLGVGSEAITVRSMREAAGAVFGVRVGGRGCVVGDVRPERVLVQVRGAAAEYGCLEPFTH
ncbi:hypothetical protein GCM10009557_73820 [Virgisporangium ochraceum]